MRTKTNREIILGIMEGHEDCFKAFFMEHYSKFVSFVYAITGSREAAKDIVQEAFLKIWMKRRTLDPEESLKNLLYVIVKRDSLNYMSRHMSRIERIKSEHGSPSQEDVIDEVDSKQMLTSAMKVIDQLPPQRRRAFVLSRFTDMSNEEIASQMGLSVNTVNRHINLAVKELKKNI